MNSSETGGGRRVLPAGSAWRRVEIAPLPPALGNRTRSPGLANADADAAGDDDAGRREAAHRAALEDAHRRGVAEGERRAAAAQAAREHALGETLAEQWARRLAAFDAELERLRVASADRLLILATRLGAGLACRQIALDPQAIVAVVDEALACLVDDFRTLTVVASPTDIEVLRPHLDQHFPGRRITLRPDDALARGSCHLLADDASVDARMETRLANLLAGLGLATDACAPAPAPPAVADPAGGDAS
ncbi:MAG: FliH/SctL family protein [Lautropia sp.]